MPSSRGEQHGLHRDFRWNKVDEVVKSIPGVIAHPQYGGYGWVRLPISSKDDLNRAKELIHLTYLYLRTIRGVSLPKKTVSYQAIEKLRDRFPRVNFEIKETAKRLQVITETSGEAGYENADNVLNQAIQLLRQSTRARP